HLSRARRVLAPMHAPIRRRYLPHPRWPAGQRAGRDRALPHPRPPPRPLCQLLPGRPSDRVAQRLLPGPPHRARPHLATLRPRPPRSSPPPPPGTPPASLGAQVLPPSGKLSWTVTDKAKRPIPARITVRGVKATPDPFFGDDPDQGAALNTVHAEHGTGVRDVP